MNEANHELLNEDHECSGVDNLETLIWKEGFVDVSGRKDVSDNDICESCPALPHLVWANILERVYSFPLRFTLRSVCRYWSFIIDNHYSDVGVIDVQRWLNLDPERTIDQQVKFVLSLNKAIRGLTLVGHVDREYDVTIRPMHLLHALLLALERFPEKFQVLEIEELGDWMDLSSPADFDDLVEVALGRFHGNNVLKVLRVAFRRIHSVFSSDLSFDLTEMTKLVSISMTGVSFVNCVASSLQKFELSSAKLDFFSLQNACENVKHLKLQNVSQFLFEPPSSTNLTLSFPCLESLHVGRGVDLGVSFDLSRSFQLCSLFIHMSSTVTFVGFDMRKCCKLSTFIVEHMKFEQEGSYCVADPVLKVNFSDLYSMFRCSHFDLFEQFCLDVSLPLKSYIFLLGKLSGHSVNLKRLRLHCSDVDESRTSIISAHILDLVGNCVHLSYFMLYGFTLESDQVISILLAAHLPLESVSLGGVHCTRNALISGLLCAFQKQKVIRRCRRLRIHVKRMIAYSVAEHGLHPADSEDRTMLENIYNTVVCNYTGWGT